MYCIKNYTWTRQRLWWCSIVHKIGCRPPISSYGWEFGHCSLCVDAIRPTPLLRPKGSVSHDFLTCKRLQNWSYHIEVLYDINSKTMENKKIILIFKAFELFLRSSWVKANFKPLNLLRLLPAAVFVTVLFKQVMI